jgi:hypothetical protein
METLDVQSLIDEGYTEDPEALERFERPFTIPFIVLIILFVGDLALLLTGGIDTRMGGGVLIALLALIFGIIALLYYSRPRSRHTGRPLDRYRNLAPARRRDVEFLYVCAESKTFFRRVYAQGG